MTSSVKKKRRITADYLYLAPSLLLFACFIAYPVIFVVYGSLFEWSTLARMKFVGLDHFVKLMGDSVFWITIRNTFYWITLTIFFQMIIGGAIAYAIEEHTVRLRSVFRTVYFLPVVTSVVVIAIVWTNMYAPYHGILGHWMKLLGVPGQINWLGDTSKAIFAIIAVNIWEWTGFSMLMYIAGLHGIPQETKEAARIDGASGWRGIRHIYIPLLSPVHKSLILLGIIGSLQTFALVYSMTGGGPNYASEMPGTYIFRQGFVVQQMGYASAISVAVLVLTLVLTVLQIRLLGSGNFFGNRSE